MKLRFLISMLMVCMVPNAYAEQVHKVSVRTHSGVEAGIKKWGPTIDYLTQSIPGHRFEMIPYTNIDAQLKDSARQKYDFALTNPSIYIKLRHIAGARALLTLINKRQNSAQTRFGSVIFTRADRDDIIELADLKDRHIKAVSPLGFGGWQVAWREMLRNNFDPYTELGQLSYADGIQPDVVKAVQLGKADAGVVRTDMLERLSQQGVINLSEFRILHNLDTEGFPFFHSTPLYPEWPLAVMPGVDNELATKVKRALLKIQHNDSAAQSGQYVGWINALDYQGVDDMLKELRVSPYSDTDKFGFNFHYLYPLGILILILIAFLALKKPSIKLK